TELDAGSNHNLVLAGNYTNNGLYTPGLSTLVLDGGGGQSIGGTTATDFYNITVNKGSGTAVISTQQRLLSTLRMMGGTLNANGMLTLISNAEGDARIAEIIGGTIIGDIVAQRYLPASISLPTGGIYRY